MAITGGLATGSMQTKNFANQENLYETMSNDGQLTRLEYSRRSLGFSTCREKLRTDILFRLPVLRSQLERLTFIDCHRLTIRRRGINLRNTSLG